MKKELNIKKDLIGSKVFHKVLNRHFTIDYGNEDLYKRLGLNVFEAPSKPKLSKNVKNRNRSDKSTIRNSNRANYDS